MVLTKMKRIKILYEVKKTIKEPKLKEDNVVIKNISMKTFEEIVKGYNGSYVCEEFEPEDIQGKELW